MATASGVARRAHSQRYRIVLGRSQARKEVRILPFAKAREFVEAGVLKLGRVVLIDLLFAIEVSEGDGCAGGKREAFIGLAPNSVTARQPLARPVHDRIRLVQLPECPSQQKGAIIWPFNELKRTHKQRVGLAAPGRATEKRLRTRADEEGELFCGGDVRAELSRWKRPRYIDLWCIGPRSIVG